MNESNTPDSPYSVLRTSYFRVPAAAATLALVFFLFHLPYFPKSLEDLDSINFALGVRDFDVAQHQPHPPGYPIYILAAKTAHLLIPSEASALVALSVTAGALGIFAIAAFVRRLSTDDDWWTFGATLLAVTSPLYWFTAERPLSDMVGLAAAVAVQAMTLAVRTPGMLYAASFVAALATGIRSQVAWLTVPLIALMAILINAESGRSRTDRGASGFSRPILAFKQLIGAGAVFIAGVLVWAIPLVMLSGGPTAYWRALTFQGSADLGNIQMLWTRHGVRDIADALYFAFVAPWVTWPVAIAVLLFVMVGAVVLLFARPRALLLLAVAFGPYLVFDLLFQETFTSRYAMPLVVPMGYLAAMGLRAMPWRSGAVVLAAIAMFDAHTAGTSVAAFASQPAPAFRLLADMRSAAASGPAPVLAMDRKQSFDFRRPIVWVGGDLPRFDRTLPTPPQHEWLEAVKYWTGGGRAPVWFVVDPKRAAIDLVHHGEATRYRWPLPYPVLVGGARPDEMDWYRVDRPGWFVGEGWALTPEAAGVADVDRRTPAASPIDAWVSRDVLGGVLMIGGRNFEATAETHISMTLDGESPAEFAAPPGPFLKFYALPATSAAPGDYLKVAVGASPPVRLAIEQFDAAATRTIFGFGAGWHEQEFNPRTGARWRWLSERGELRFGSPTPRRMLHVEGESPRTYFPRASRLTARVGDRIVFEDALASDFAVDIPIPNGTELVTLETDQVFQPADRSRRSADRRHLGLRIFKCELRPASQ